MASPDPFTFRPGEYCAYFQEPSEQQSRAKWEAKLHAERANGKNGRLTVQEVERMWLKYNTKINNLYLEELAKFPKDPGSRVCLIQGRDGGDDIGVIVEKLETGASKVHSYKIRTRYGIVTLTEERHLMVPYGRLEIDPNPNSRRIFPYQRDAYGKLLSITSKVAAAPAPMQESKVATIIPLPEYKRAPFTRRAKEIQENIQLLSNNNALLKEPNNAKLNALLKGLNQPHNNNGRLGGARRKTRRQKNRKQTRRTRTRS